MRKSIIAIVISVVAVVAIGTIAYSMWGGYFSPPAPPSQHAYDWPMFGYDSALTQYSSSRAPHEFKLAWSHDYNVTYAEESFSGPFGIVVSKGILYFESTGGTVYAVNSKDGSLIWNKNGIPEENGWVHYIPLVADEKLILARADGPVIALDAYTGAWLWNSSRLPFTSYPPMYPLISPVFSDGKIFIGAGDTMYAIDIKTGSTLWNFSCGTLFNSPPSISDGKVFAFASEGSLYALNESTGALVWGFNASSSLFYTSTSPVYVDGRVFINAGDVYALNATSGEVLWEAQNASNWPERPSGAAYGILYVRDFTSLTALNQTNGNFLWRRGISSGSWFPVIADGMFFEFAGDTLCAYNATSGEIIWYDHTLRYSAGELVIADGLIYAFGNGFWYGVNYSTIYAIGTYSFT